MQSYKHHCKVTSQIYFCASPIRLDAYNRCQFGCVYCFSRERSILTSAQGVRTANASAFFQRMQRVSKGHINSVLDEFLQRRVPIQLGGMQDPFSPWETKYGTTKSLLEALISFDYPTMISTKGVLVAEEPYISLLASGNFYVRISAAGVSEAIRSQVDYKCSDFAGVLSRISKLNARGIPTSLRIQPVIPGFEEDALNMARTAQSAGVRHVSIEFLKLPWETRKEITNKISNAAGFDLLSLMKQRGMKKLGPDYTLDVPFKREFLKEARSSLTGLKIGAGDTELIHLSDGGGCCNGSALFLRDCNQFDCNLTGLLYHQRQMADVRFSDFDKFWSPSGNVHQYLTTDSRVRDTSGQYSDWMSLLAYRWNGEKGPYSPMLLDGVSDSGEIDESGMKIYRYDRPIP